MNQLSRRDWALMAVTVIVCLIPLFALGSYIATKYAAGQEQLSRLEPRFARLLGLQASAGKMDEKVALLNDRMSLFIYPSDKDATQAGNEAQGNVRNVLTTAGMTVVSSQVLPAKTEQGFERISLSVRAEGELIHLQAALAVLPSLAPVILVDGIDIQVVGVQRADRPQRLGADLKLSVLHRKPA